jgi:hypothetical protein
MTPTAQRIALANAVGKKLDTTAKFVLECEHCHEGCYREDEWDPLNDLNAVHEVEKVLTREQRVRFINELCGLIGVRWKPTSHFDSVHATAAQRCEAILKTLNQWDDTK